MLNPILSTFGISSVLVDFIFDGLTKIDENMIARPGLAESWEVSGNSLVWTFHIRQGVTFHDGIPLTADDVKFTLEAISNPLYPNQFSHILASIKNIVLTDDHTIRITLRHPFPSLPYYLYLGILPKRVYEGQDLRNTPLNYYPIGTGPYRLARWSEAEWVLEANHDYFLGKPIIPTIIVKMFKTRKAAWAKLVSGKIDTTLLVEPETIQIIEQFSHLKVYSYVHPYYYMIALNSQKDIFREQAVRQALNYAVDKKRLIKEVLGGIGQVVSGLTYPGSTFNPMENLAYPYDPNKASRLLAQSGWADVDGDGILERNGEEFQFTAYVQAEGFLPEKVFLYIQRQLADVGVQVRMIGVPLPELLERYVKRGRFDAVLWNFSAIGDPGINYLFWSSSQIKDGLNFSNYRNSIVDNLLERGRSALGLGDRIDAYRAFQREIFRDPPGIFLFWRNLYIVLPKSVRGVRVGPGAAFISIHQWYFEPEGRM
jgi:peptide/nickel transport system substrate-binding protein